MDATALSTMINKAHSKPVPAAQWLGRTIPSLFDAIAEEFDDKIAIHDGELALTYANIRERSLSLAASIREHPPGPVGVLISKQGIYSWVALACLRTGRPVVFLDQHHPDSRQRAIVREAGLRMLVSDFATDVGDAFDGLPRLGAFGIDSTPALEQSSAAESVNAPAFVMYTSGSTGLPKGICNGQAAIVQRAAHFTTSCGLEAADRLLLLTSCGTIAGVRDTFTALLNGATLIVAQPGQVGLKGVTTAILRHRATVMYSVPALMRELLGAEDAAATFASLRVLRLGGDLIWDKDVDLCRDALPSTCRILIGYGSTEVPTVLQFAVPDGWTGDGSRMPVGYPQPGSSMTLVDDDDNQVDPGEAGELVVRSKYLALGLWQDGKLQPGLTAHDSRSALDGPAMRTGDILRARTDGLFVLIGRKGRQVKLNGRRVDPGELEAALRSSPDVAEAAVITRMKNGEATAFEAFIVPQQAHAPFRQTVLKDRLRTIVPAYLLPKKIHVIDKLPLLAGFKPDLAALEALASELSDDGDSGQYEPTAAKGGVTLDAVRRAWTATIGTEAYSRNLPWDEAGGDSLKALRLIMLLEASCSMPIPFDLIEPSTRPSELADNLDRLGSGKNVSIVQNLALPLVIVAPGLGGDGVALSALRRTLKDRLRFLVLRYPSIGAQLEARASFEAIVKNMVDQTRDVAMADEPIHFLGYSFGGFVAWELAGLLRDEGFQIGTIAMIDTHRSDQVPRPPRRRPMLINLTRSIAELWAGAVASPATALRTASRRTAWWCLSALFIVAPVAVMRPIHAAARRLPFWLRSDLLRNLNKQLGIRAVRRLVPKPGVGTAVLFRSSENLPSDYGWSRLCSSIAVEVIGGSHHSILNPPHRDVLAGKLATWISRTDPRAEALDLNEVCQPVSRPGSGVNVGS